MDDYEYFSQMEYAELVDLIKKYNLLSENASIKERAQSELIDILLENNVRECEEKNTPFKAPPKEFIEINALTEATEENMATSFQEKEKSKIKRHLHYLVAVIISALIAFIILWDNSPKKSDNAPAPTDPSKNVNRQLISGSAKTHAGKLKSINKQAPVFTPQQKRKKMYPKKKHLPNVIESVILVSVGGSPNGSAFVVEMDGGQYIITNLHLVNSVKTWEFTLSDGSKIPLDSSMEVARNKDLVRFELPSYADMPALRLAESSIGFGEKITAYGDSQGKGAITKTWGTILGTGPEVIEVSAGIVSGNSGGPVVNKQGKVVGISTFLTRRKLSWVNANTRYSRTRRLALRLDCNIDWIECSTDDFREQVAILNGLHNFANEIHFVCENYKRPINPKNKIKNQSVKNVAYAFEKYRKTRLGEIDKYMKLAQAFASVIKAIDEKLEKYKSINFYSEDMEKHFQLLAEHLNEIKRNSSQAKTKLTEEARKLYLQRK
jgi:hypothetical protein